MAFFKNVFLVLASACLLCSQSVFSQKNYTMKDAVLGSATHLAVENISGLSFRPHHDAYTYINKEKTAVMYRDMVLNKETALLTLEEQQNFEGKTTNNGIEPKYVPNITWLDADHFYFSVKKDDETVRYYICAAVISKNHIGYSQYRYYDIPANAQNQEWCPVSKSLAYTVDNNLHLSYSDNRNIVIAEDKNENIIYGQSVHRNEFGIHKGIFHSPKGNYIAFYRMDQTMVADYPIINWLENTAVNKDIKYPMAGGVSHHVTLGVYNPSTKQTVYLKTGEPKEQYLTCVTWDPNEEFIYIAVLNRGQNHLRLNQYDARSGNFIKTLFEESHSKYVEPQNELFFLPHAKEFVWMSQRDGYMHAYIYDTDGKLKKQLTTGSWLVKEMKGFDSRGLWMYFTSTQNSPLGTTISRVNVKSGKIENFNDDLGIGMRAVAVSSSGNYIIDNFRNPENPRNISLVNTKNKKKTILLKADNPLKNYSNSIVKNVRLHTENGIELYGRLMLPHDFDSTRHYPVIVYLYNGPHVQLITQSFPESGNLWYDYLTQKGFIVWSMDGRGSANRGLDFEQAVHNNLGEKEAYDHMVGVDYIKSLPYVDSERMGIYGWSYGGFMTTYMMTHYPDVFKAGVAGGPVIDWRMYEIMYTERYMSSPEVNGEGYDKNNLLNHVKNLKGKLLMIHGADDDVVVWQHSMKFIKACVDNNIPIDYFVYPGHPHNVRGKDRVHLMEKISDYFIQNL